jgi:hypothetical protein
MTHPPSDFMVADLGECIVPSPLRDTRFIEADERVPYRDDLDELRGYLQAGVEPPSFELAGPRDRIFFDPARLKTGCGPCGLVRKRMIIAGHGWCPPPPLASAQRCDALVARRHRR